MNPAIIQWLLTATSAAATLKSLFGESPKFPSVESQIQTEYAPIREALLKELARVKGERADIWGSRGLLGGAGHRKEVGALESKYADIVAGKLGEISQRVSSEARQRKVLENLIRKSQYAKLGGELGRIPMMYLSSWMNQKMLEDLLKNLGISGMGGGEFGIDINYPVPPSTYFG